MKTSIFCLLFLVTTFSAFAQLNFEGRYRITPWSGNKKAAACITFDDNCPGQFDFALPELNQRNLKATFFIITAGSQCGMANWTKIDSAFAKGHEIASHSKTHINMANSDSATIETELRDSYDTLRKRYYPEGWKLTIGYPFGRGGGSSAQDKRIRRLAQKYYYGGRSAGVGASGFTGYTDYTNPFYNAFYMQWGTYVMGPGNLPTAAQLSGILDNTIQAGGVFTGLYHGIESGGFNNLPTTTFKEHLDSMVARNQNLWITTFGKAIQYHTERRAEPKLKLINYREPDLFARSYYTFRLEDTLTQPEYREPLTIRLHKYDQSTFNWVDSLKGNIQNQRLEGDSIWQFDIVPGDTVWMRLQYVISVSDKISKDGFCMFPNPTQGPVLLRVDKEEWKDKKLEITMMDASGKTIPKTEIRKIGNGMFQISPPAYLAKGIYSIRISHGKEQKVIQLDWSPR